MMMSWPSWISQQENPQEEAQGQRWPVFAGFRDSLVAASEAVQHVTNAAASAGSRAREAIAEAAATLRAEDPEDSQGTVTCSELAGELCIKPGERGLEVVSAWFGHSSDASRRRDITEAARLRVTAMNGLRLEASTRVWGDPAPGCFKVLSVSYRREASGAPTPGERLRAEVAKNAVACILERATYEALKRVAGSPAMGSWICAASASGSPAPGSSLHAIFVSPAELILWFGGEKGPETLSYRDFLTKARGMELRVERRPNDVEAAEEIVRRARELLWMKPGPGAPEEAFRDSESFAAYCHKGADGSAAVSGLAVAKAAGTMGAAVLVAAHIDEAAAAVALPLFGVAPAVAVGVIGATVVSPLLLAGLWHLKRCNDDRLGFAALNLTRGEVAMSAFELGDANRVDWGPVRSSCHGIGGCASGSLEPQQLVELNPPSSSDLFQLCCHGKVEDSLEDGEEGTVAEGQKESCVQIARRGSVYWIMWCGGVLVIREVPRSLLPAYAEARAGAMPASARSQGWHVGGLGEAHLATEPHA